MRSNSRVLGLGLLILAALLAATWWSIRPGRGARPAEVAVRAEPRGPALELAEAAEPVRTATEGDATSAGSSASPAARARTGKLRVRVEDAATRAPLAGIELRIARERGGDKLLATGTTDERGEARFEDVEANTVIVEARRAPPHARAFGAVWLEGDETETVVLAMGAGRTVRGRVVDDLGTPLAGAIVAANDDYGSRFRAGDAVAEPDATAVTTSADGTFELAHLAPSPRQVWIERGAMAPRSWSSQSVHVRFEDARAWARTTIDATDPEAPEDVGDVVVPRACTWSGRVVDAHGAPIADALVSARFERAWSRQLPFARRDASDGAWPGLAGFRLREQECQCDPLGRFELRCRPSRPNVAVWTPRGIVQTFDLPALEPGGRADDVQLRVVDATLLALELVDETGARILGPHPRSRGTSRPASKRLFGDGLAVTVRGEGVDLETSILADPDGVYRIQLDGAVGGSAVVRLDMAGYRPIARQVDIGAQDPLRFVLEPLDLLRLRVRFEGQPVVDTLKPRRVVLHACIEDPAPRRTARMSPYDDGTCCGLGAVRTIDVEPGTTECVLPVEADRPFFVSVRDQAGLWLQTFGPWRPGDSAHDIVVPELAPRDDGEKPLARVRARVSDARTGEAIDAHIYFADPAEDAGVLMSPGVPWAVIDANGNGLRDAPAGRWRMSVRSQGYRTPPTIEVDLAPGVERDLGAFALEPLPVVEVALTGAERDSVHIDFADSDARWIASSQKVEDRTVVLGDLPPRGIATVYESTESSGERVQRIAFEYDGSGRIELRLAPWRAVELRCPVAEPSGFAASMRLAIVDPRFPDGSRFERVALSERAPDADARRFAGWLAPGAYVVRATSIALGDFEARFEVPAAGGGVVRVELHPAR